MSVSFEALPSAPSIVNRFAHQIPPSPTLAMSERAAALQNQGHHVINLSIGEPDLCIPEWIRNTAIAHIQQGDHIYTPVAGLAELRQAVVDKLARENDLPGYTPAQVIVGNGAKQVLFNALMVSLEPGDEVIVPAPYWVSYPTMVTMAGGQPIVVSCEEAQGFKLTPDALESALTAKTKWIILNAPSNPTGAVYTLQELKALAAVLARHPHVWVLSDDIYEHLCYPPHSFCSILNVAPELAPRTLIVNGVSKSFAMTGWRIGYGVGPQELIKAMVRFQSHTTSGANCIAQRAAIAALCQAEDAQQFLDHQRRIFQERRDTLVHALRQTFTLDTPAGAFYVYVNVKNLIARKSLKDDMDLAQRLLEDAHVSTVPGTEFGLPNFLRLSYALAPELLTQAGARIYQWSQS